MDLCHEIDSIDCELAVYRRGFLNIRLDLVKGLIIWNDSNHWSNNFVRSLTFSEVEMIRRLLPELCSVHGADCSCPVPGTIGVLHDGRKAAVPAEDALHGSNWQITLHHNEECWCIKGQSQRTQIWRKTIRTIEQISRIPVRVQ